MVRVLIRTDIGGTHGLGHAVRCKALAQALAARGAEVKFCTITSALAAFVAPFHVVEAWQPNMATKGCDVYIIDTKASVTCDSRWFARDIHVVRIDDMQATPATCDLLIAPGAHWSAETIARLQASFGERFLFGWDYVMLHGEVTKHAPVPYKQRMDGPIVFCAGGSDLDGILEQIWTWTEYVTLTAHMRFCIGDGYQGRLRNFLMPPLHAPTAGMPFPRSVVRFSREALRTASLVVSIFGVTVYECLALRTPVITIARTLDDAYAASELVSRSIYRSDDGTSAVISLGYIDIISRESLCSYIQKCIEHIPLPQSMHAASTGLIDGHGVERIANAILGIV